jgi:hypothetical protein
MVGYAYMPSNNYSADRNERIIAHKNTAKKELLGKYKLPKSTRYISCIDLHDSKTRDFVIQGLADLGIAVFITGKTTSKSSLIQSVHDFDTEFLEGCDFLVSDSHTSPARITACILAGIIPVVPKNTPFKGMFSQFDPMQFTGNSFVYDGGQYQIFASVVALLENMKFPADREILLKNVVKTL